MKSMKNKIKKYIEKKNIKQCIDRSKNRYTNEKSAKQAMHQQMNWGARVCRVYYCNLCKGWHLTSIKKDWNFNKRKICRKDRRELNCKGIHGGGGVRLLPTEDPTEDKWLF